VEEGSVLPKMVRMFLVVLQEEQPCTRTSRDGKTLTLHRPFHDPREFR
jgi:hypothetical protein